MSLGYGGLDVLGSERMQTQLVNDYSAEVQWVERVVTKAILERRERVWCCVSELLLSHYPA